MGSVYVSKDIESSVYLYPFGMTMPGRKYSLGTVYRFGFNGKENDNDVKGEGNQQDYGMRIYDTRIAKFLSVDPLECFYPWYTPYQFAGNSPIAAIDLDGGEPLWMIDQNGRFTKPIITLLTAGLGYRESRMKHVRWHKTGTRYYGNTIFNRIGYNPRITESQIANTEEYLSLWFTLIAHEGRHRNEYPLALWLAWGAAYGITDWIPNQLFLPYEKGLFESRAYSHKTEGKIVNLVNHKDGLILKALESGEDEGAVSDIVAYSVASYNYETALEKNNGRKGLFKLLGKIKVGALKRQMESAEKKVDKGLLDKLNEKDKRSIRMPHDGGKEPNGNKRPDVYKDIRKKIKEEKDAEKKAKKESRKNG